jgi:ribosomal protein L32
MPKLTVCPGCGRDQYRHEPCGYCGSLVEAIPATAHKAQYLRDRYDHDQALREKWLEEREAFVREHGEAAWSEKVKADVADL